MTSPKKMAANRMNGRKSCGPRTIAGKARASRNARRHGLAAFGSKDDRAMTEQIEQMVDAICAGNDDPLLRQQAGMIAENQIWLACVRTEKVALIERLRDPTAYALASRTRIAQAKLRIRLFDIAGSQVKTIDALMQKTIAAGGDPEREPIPPKLEAAWPPPCVKGISNDGERDEYESLREGIRDLMRLCRYERRAWSRRKRAVRAFLAVKQIK
jgi:hypothetical protein